MFDLDLIISQPQEAFIWFIPLIFAGVGLVGVVAIAAITSDVEPVSGKTIAVLGMQGAGKTQFLAHLRNMSYKTFSASLGVEKYSTFSTKIGGREVKIEGGMDVPGGDEYVRTYYADLIKKNETIFFFFNTHSYLSDEIYNLNTRARLDFINEKIKDTSKEVVIIGTFADRFEDDNKRKSAFNKILNSVNNKPYGPLFKINFAILDMRKKEMIFDFLAKIFV